MCVHTFSCFVVHSQFQSCVLPATGDVLPRHHAVWYCHTMKLLWYNNDKGILHVYNKRTIYSESSSLSPEVWRSPSQIWFALVAAPAQCAPNPISPLRRWCVARGTPPCVQRPPTSHWSPSNLQTVQCTLLTTCRPVMHVKVAVTRHRCM